MNDALSNWLNGKKEEAKDACLIDEKLIEELINVLRGVLFPKYFYCPDNPLATAKSFLEQLICSCSSQNYKVEIIDAFLAQLPKIEELLKQDIEAFVLGDPAANSEAEIILCYPGLFAILVYRLAHELAILNVPILPRLMSEYAHNKTGIDINPNAVIGHHFFIDHGTGIVIGNYVKIYQGVTLGALSLRDGSKLKGIKRHPTILDYVTIYSSASIFGGETVIGPNVTIGSNAYITSSVEANTIIAKSDKRNKV